MTKKIQMYTRKKLHKHRLRREEEAKRREQLDRQLNKRLNDRRPDDILEGIEHGSTRHR